MANVNKVFLIGRLTRDPELRFTPAQMAVTDLGLAVNRTYPGKDGESKEETLFIDVTVWARQAENCCQFLKKGRQVHVEGYLRLDTWDDKTTGEKRSKVRVVAENVQFLDRREDSSYGSGSSSSQSDYDEAPPARAPRGSSPEARGGNGPASRSYTPTSRPEPEDADDDIPF